jgi:hypothetical protein
MTDQMGGCRSGTARPVELDAATRRQRRAGLRPVHVLGRWLQARQGLVGEAHRLALARLGGAAPAELHHHPRPRAGSSPRPRPRTGNRRGKYRGPLHGIPTGEGPPDTAGIRTTWGAEPFLQPRPEGGRRRRRPAPRRRSHPGGQASLGARAQRRLWPDQHPRFPEGREARRRTWPAVSAGWSPRHRKRDLQHRRSVHPVRAGYLRPTFGRVPRTGAMTSPEPRQAERDDPLGGGHGACSPRSPGRREGLLLAAEPPRPDATRG